MLNPKLGQPVEIDGHPWIVTTRGRAGFALYGPYEMLPAGDYVVEYRVILDEGQGTLATDPACLVLNVATDEGRRELARQPVHHSQLGPSRTSFALPLTLGERARVEFRAWVSGDVGLRIADRPRVVPVRPGDTPEEAMTSSCFPDREGEQVAFFREHRDLLRGLFERGAWVRIEDGRVRARVAGVWIACDCADDLAFVGEVFDEGAYNFGTDAPVCAIDIGMNVGLSSLLFASKPEVRRVHGFEPFRNTFDRALANLRLNPGLAAKIATQNVGLSDRDFDDTLLVTPVESSGAANVIEVAHGQPVRVVLRDAGTLLGPLIAEARAAGERVIVKVDCEGSEYAVFQSLARAGLLERIDAFMVEWHRMFEGVTQEAMLAPLRAAGFLVFDRSPAAGNGFFYAVRLGPSTSL